MKNSTRDEEIFICQCYSPEHQIRFLYFDFIEEKYSSSKEIIAQIHLDPKAKFWDRIWLGVKYIFKSSHIGGHWAEFIVNKDDAKRLIEFLKQIEN